MKEEEIGEQIDTSSKPPKEKDSDFGFEKVSEPMDLEQSSEFSVISKENPIQALSVDSFEHLSQYDPDDEFLQGKASSVIDSVLSGEYKKSSAGFSDYSMVEKSLAIDEVSRIETKRDIYAEDVIMSQIIYYVSLFSQEMLSSLSKLRSKDSLLSKGQKIKYADEGGVQQELFLDLDDIDDEFVNVLLDSLEQFELYKLCLIVCNRYRLNERVGRYLVSIAHKYTVVEYKDKNLELLLMQQFRENQRQVSFVAHQAMHSALELVEPSFLQVKPPSVTSTSDNSLGSYCYQGLFSLGYWKKLVYMVDFHSATCLTSMFADLYNLKVIYLLFREEGTQRTKVDIDRLSKADSFEFLGRYGPQSESDVVAFKGVLDSFLWRFKAPRAKFPKCFKLSETALRLYDNPSDIKELKRLIDKISLNINKIYNGQTLAADKFTDDCMAYDSVAALAILFYSAYNDNSVRQVSFMSHLDLEHAQSLFRSLQLILILVKFRTFNVAYSS